MPIGGCASADILLALHRVALADTISNSDEPRLIDFDWGTKTAFLALMRRLVVLDGGPLRPRGGLRQRAVLGEDSSFQMAYNRAHSINSITAEKGSAPMIMTDLRASIPPAISSVMMTNPSSTLHRTMCRECVPSSEPPETMVLMTSTAESAEVTR